MKKIIKKTIFLVPLLVSFCTKGPLTQIGQSRHTGSFLSGRVVLGSELISDGKNFYFGTKNGNVFCVDSKNQKNIWKQKLSGSVDTSVLVANGKVYVGTGDGALQTLDLQTGSFLWKTILSAPPRGRMTQIASMILVGTNDGFLSALNQENGTIIWKYHHEPYEKMKIQFFIQGSVDQNLLFIGFPNGQLVSLNAQTGEEIWKKSIEDPMAAFYDLSSVILLPGKGVLATLVSGPSVLFSFEGVEQWKVQDTSTQAEPLIIGDKILFATKDKILWTDLNGKEISTIKYPRPIRPAGLAFNQGMIYVTSLDGDLHVFDEKSSTWLWDYKLGESVQGAPIIQDEKIWTLTRAGQLFSMKQR